MGDYTELVMGVKIKDNPKVLNILRYMLKTDHDKSKEQVEVFDHDFFKTYAWEWMFMSDSYYFDGDTHYTLRHDDISDGNYLTIRCNLKNYDCQIEEFLNWLCPYIETEGFLGYKRFEYDEDPTLLYREVDENGRSSIDYKYM